MLFSKISSVTLLTGNGMDHLTIRIPAADIINKVTKGELTDGLVGTDIFGPNLAFEVRITKGCGEKLANELGLTITKRVNTCGL